MTTEDGIDAADYVVERALGITRDREEEIVKMVEHARTDAHTPLDAMVEVLNKLHAPEEAMLAGVFIGYNMR